MLSRFPWTLFFLVTGAKRSGRKRSKQVLPPMAIQMIVGGDSAENATNTAPIVSQKLVDVIHKQGEA
jgi:hypothetical protein